MKILIIGNCGYVGPLVVRRLRAELHDATLIGFDTGYFAHCLTSSSVLPEAGLSSQHFGDLRAFPGELLNGVDAVINLAAISNDTMGRSFETATFEINHRACIELAKKAKVAGVRSFVFSSSCSVYGFAEDGPRTERSSLEPLTAYARSKVFSERDLQPLAAPNFRVTCLRFATACGMSDRLRLDLVLNDFVASALWTKKIKVLSDGTPWRPLIHVNDMARAILWATQKEGGSSFLVVNVGSNSWNYQVRTLAERVALSIPGTEMSINSLAPPDKRSYRVDFDLFKSLAPEFLPEVELDDAIEDLKKGILAMQPERDFESGALHRINTLLQLRQKGFLDDQLNWLHHMPRPL